DSERLSASAWAESNEVTSARRASSLPQASLRKAVRWLGSRSRAAPTISLILSHPSGLPMGPPLHLSSEPGLGNVPIAFGGRAGDAQDLGSFFGGQAAEETQLDKAALLFVDLHQGIQSVVEGHDVRARHLRKALRGVQFDAALRAALGCAMAARVVHKDLPHELGGDTHEMRAVLCVERALAAETQIGFVNKRCGLERVAMPLASEIVVSHGTQLGVNKGDEGLQGILVAGSPFHEQFTDRMRTCFGHLAPPPGSGVPK